jgi:hypothetical protein
VTLQFSGVYGVAALEVALIHRPATL